MIDLTLDQVLEHMTAGDAYLTAAVQRLLDAMEYDVPYTASQLMEMLGLRSRDSFRRLYLNPALDKGMIVMSIPENPTSRNQSYIKK